MDEILRKDTSSDDDEYPLVRRFDPIFTPENKKSVSSSSSSSSSQEKPIKTLKRKFDEEEKKEEEIETPKKKKSKTENTPKKKRNIMEPVNCTATAPLDQLFLYQKRKEGGFTFTKIRSHAQVYSFDLPKDNDEKKDASTTTSTSTTKRKLIFHNKKGAIRDINTLYNDACVNRKNSSGGSTLHHKISFLIKKGVLVASQEHSVNPFLYLIYKNKKKKKNDGDARYTCLFLQDETLSIEVVNISKEVIRDKTLLQEFQTKFHEKRTTPHEISLLDDSDEIDEKRGKEKKKEDENKKEEKYYSSSPVWGMPPPSFVKTDQEEEQQDERPSSALLTRKTEEVKPEFMDEVRRRINEIQSDLYGMLIIVKNNRL